MATARHHAIPTDTRASIRMPSVRDDLTARFVLEVISLREALCQQAVGLTSNHADAEDLVQETIVKAYVAFQSFQQGTNVRSWLSRIVLNSYINHTGVPGVTR